MKNDVSKGSENRLPEHVSVGKTELYQPARKRNLFWGGLAGFVQAIKRKRFFEFWRKETKSDGSCIETKITYREDD
jgi:hypothetical protein